MRCLAIAIAALLSPAAFAAQLYPAPGGLEVVTADEHIIFVPLEKTSRKEALKTAIKIWGEPADAGVMHECGAGEIAFTEFDNGLRLHFQHGAFMGWTTIADAAPSLRNGFGMGSKVGEVSEFAGPVEIEETTLGYEFWGENFFGFASEPNVDGVVDFYWSGINCMFR